MRNVESGDRTGIGWRRVLTNPGLRPAGAATAADSARRETGRLPGASLLRLGTRRALN